LLAVELNVPEDPAADCVSSSFDSDSRRFARLAIRRWVIPDGVFQVDCDPAEL